MDFCLFLKKMGKYLSNKYGQKHLDSAKKFRTDAIKTASKRAIKKQHLNCTYKMRMKQKYQKKDIYLQKKGNKSLMSYLQHNNIRMEYQKIINLLDNTSN